MLSENGKIPGSRPIAAIHKSGASEVTGHAQAVSITPPGRANLTEGGLRYGIFQQCSTGTADSRRGPRSRSRYLEANGIPVYSPRSDMFFERQEVRQILGCLMLCFQSYLGDLKRNSFTHLISDTLRDYYISCVKEASVIYNGKDTQIGRSIGGR